MKAKNQYQKYKYYLLKRKDIFFHGLQKSQMLGRKIGPKVVLNSLPKSGTHLLESLFFKLPLMRHNGDKTLMVETQNPIPNKLKHITALKKGQFLLSHMQFHTTIIDAANLNGVKIINLIRDPRDVIISHLNYVQNMDKTQKSHKLISQYDNRLDRLKVLIDGKINIIEPFTIVLDKFQPWTVEPKVLSVKFEHLIGSNGGGNDQHQKVAVSNIAEFISIKIGERDLENICKNIFSTRSSTFNKGKIGNWKNVLNEEEKIWLNKTLKEHIETYGYTIN